MKIPTGPTAASPYPSGFGLVEAVVASGLLIVLSAGLAHLTVLSGRAVGRTAAQSVALFLAAQRLEQLKSLRWAIGASGVRSSPPDALERSLPGSVDYLDRDGARVGSGPQPPPGTRYLRRWAIRDLPSRSDVLVLDVVVVPLGVTRPDTGARFRPTQPGVVRLVTLVSVDAHP